MPSGAVQCRESVHPHAMQQAVSLTQLRKMRIPGKAMHDAVLHLSGIGHLNLLLLRLARLWPSYRGRA